MQGILSSPLGSRRYQGPSSGRAISLCEAQTIAESIVGTVSWHGAEGYCLCPGEDQHTTRTTATDCKVVCAAVEKSDGLLRPGVYCFHDNCRGAAEEASFLLRSALGKRGPGQPWQFFSPRSAPKPKVEFDPDKLKKVAAQLDGIDAAWFAVRSPIRPDNRTPVSFLQALYRPGEKLLIFDVFESQGQGLWTCESTAL